MSVGAMFLINGRPYPPPVMTPIYETQRLVEGMRNNRGEDISQPIGIELEKFSSLEWPNLTADEWEGILRDKLQHRVELTYYSPQRSAVVTRTFYWGNTSAEPSEYEDTPQGVLRPTRYKNCQTNLIDSGRD